MSSGKVAASETAEVNGAHTSGGRREAVWRFAPDAARSEVPIEPGAVGGSTSQEELRRGGGVKARRLRRDDGESASAVRLSLLVLRSRMGGASARASSSSFERARPAKAAVCEAPPRGVRAGEGASRASARSAASSSGSSMCAEVPPRLSLLGPAVTANFGLPRGAPMPSREPSRQSGGMRQLAWPGARGVAPMAARVRLAARAVQALTPEVADTLDPATAVVFEPRGITPFDTFIFVLGCAPFVWAGIEFWRRIAVGDPFGTGADQVIINDTSGKRKTAKRRVLGRGAIIAAYVLFAIAGASLALVVAAGSDLL